MKTKSQILTLILLVLSPGAYAKAQSGIYMNPSDYKNNKLAYEKECTKAKHNNNIRLHSFFGNMPYITVYSEGKKNKLRKNEVFGYRDCNDNVYRFYNNAEYCIAEAGNIYIYTQTKNITQSKGFKVVNAYYFSASPDGEILPLTLYNLQKAYHDNEKFLSLLDQFFSSNDINAYDNLHQTFKVNYVYSKAMKQ